MQSNSKNILVHKIKRRQKQRYRFCTFLFVFFLTLSGIYAQNEDLVFRKYATKDGLSQRSVTAIVQDNKGYMWFGTRYGLNRFDGHTFVNYYYSATDNQSLSDSWVTSLLMDKSGILWVGTKNGLNRYDPKEDNFKRIQTDSAKDEFLRGEIQGIVEDTTGEGIWLATNMGLWHYTIKTKALRKYRQSHQNNKSISSNVTRSLIPAKDHNLWVCTNLTVDRFDIEKQEFRHFEYPDGRSPQHTKNGNVVIFEDKEGNVWLGYDAGLAFFDSVTNTFVPYRDADEKKPIKTNVRSIHEDNDGTLWIGTYEGLYTLNREGDVQNYTHNVQNPNSISQNSIYDIISDDRGDLWIGTWAGGVNYVNRKDKEFLTYSVGTEKDNLNYQVVSAAVTDDSGNLWIGTEGGGLNVYNTKTKRFTYYVHNDKIENSLVDNNVKAIIKDHEGNFWVGTHNKGINYVSTRGENVHFKKVMPLGAEDTDFSNNQITALLEDTNHNIWIGTTNSGLQVYHKKTNQLLNVKDYRETLGSFVHTIIHFSDSTLLVGGNGGLGIVNINSYHTQKVDFKKEANSIYDKEKVISLSLTSDNSVWIGTEGDGLYAYNFKTKSSKRYDVKDGLPGDVVYGILQDDNNLWLSTNRGLGKFDPLTLEHQIFDYSDGIQGNEFNYGAAKKTETGELFFGGVNGFTLFNPKKISKDDYFPKMEIRAFKTQGQTIFKGFNGDENETIGLAYNQNDITIDYVALGFSQPDKNQYSYILEGFDTEWKNAGNGRTATYTNLDPGEYIFNVKATNSDGIWGGQLKTVNFLIKPPIWRTWWAYLSYLLLLSIIFFVIRKYSILRIHEKAELRQERQNREKEGQLNQLKLQLFTNISHDFRTPLTLIIGPLKRMVDKGNLEPAVAKRLEGMYRNATILLQLINQLLDFRKSEMGKLKLSAEKLDLVAFLRETKLLFEEFAQEKGIDYSLDVPESMVEVWLDRIEMKKVIINILSNAFKFTDHDGRIQLSVTTKNSTREDNGYACIAITDNGKGIREQDLPHIFDRYFQLGQKNEFRSGTGVGLALAKDIIDLHRGKVEIKSKIDEGTTFIISLPLGHSHLDVSEIKKSNTAVVKERQMEVFNPVMAKTGWTNVNDESADSSPHEKIDQEKDTLLLVEDNEEVRRFIKELFTNSYNILEAANGNEGLAKANTENVHLIISDVMMPKMDGMEFCEKIKQDLTTSHIPVILLTARTSVKTQKMGYNTGADVYITKPFEADLLIAQVGNLLNSRKKLIEKFRKEIILSPQELDIKSPDEIFLNDAVSVVENNLDNSSFSSSELTSKMNMSQSVFYRKIKALTGMPISGFIRSIRLKKAAQLLEQTTLGVSIIAYDVGFSDLKYFRKCFKDQFGVTPSKFRKK